MAFKDFNVIKGINGSPWQDLDIFNIFFEGPTLDDLENTLGISLRFACRISDSHPFGTPH